MSRNAKVAEALDGHSPTGGACSSSNVQQVEQDATRKVAGASSSRAQAEQREQDAPTTLVPELRFPEFQNTHWNQNKLSLLAKPVKEKAKELEPDDVLTLSGEFGLVSQTEYFGKKIAGSDLKRYIRIEQNDFVYNDRTTSSAKYGSLKRLTNYQIGAVSPIYKCFRFKKQEKPEFWDHYFNAGAHEGSLSEFINEGARAGRFNISVDTFLSITVCYPSEAEQQKIADCLGSLDDLIASHSRKLAALQDHKKGLLQQLFPAEGETTPMLRFPEFEGEWEQATLSNACAMKAGKFVKAANISANSAQNLYPCYGGNGLRGYTTTYTHDGAYSLIGRQGALCGNVQLTSGRFHATEHAIVSTPAKNVLTDWLYYALLLMNLNQFATGQAQPGLSVEVLERVSFTIPSKAEQQKIADCLSALDVTITAETKQIAALKTHKQGLMQQLFPNPDGK